MIFKAPKDFNQLDHYSGTGSMSVLGWVGGSVSKANGPLLLIKGHMDYPQTVRFLDSSEI